MLSRRRAEALLARLAPRTRLRRLLRAIRAARAQAPVSPRRLPDRYFIKHGYRSRETPAYDFEHRDDGVVWQPEVYVEAARIAERLRSRRIIDIGCGNGEKLAALHPRFEIMGIDSGPNLVACRERYAFGAWLEHDLETANDLPLQADSLRASVIVCADVIEHLVLPEHLLQKLRSAIQHADCVLVSTPERDLTWGVGQLGPPPNTAHVREWTIGEFSALLVSVGFSHGSIGLTRSNDRVPLRNTILARLFPDERRLEEALGGA